MLYSFESKEPTNWLGWKISSCIDSPDLLMLNQETVGRGVRWDGVFGACWSRDLTYTSTIKGSMRPALISALSCLSEKSLCPHQWHASAAGAVPAPWCCPWGLGARHGAHHWNACRTNSTRKRGSVRQPCEDVTALWPAENCSSQNTWSLWVSVKFSFYFPYLSLLLVGNVTLRKNKLRQQTVGLRSLMSYIDNLRTN